MSTPGTSRAPIARRKPTVRFDFSQGYLHENLPPKAVAAMRVAGIGTNRMEQELRNYYRHRGIEEIRPIRVLQIVSRYVDVYPVSYIEMESALGKGTARAFMTSRVPKYCWSIQDFLDYLDIRLGHRLRTDLNFLIENDPHATWEEYMQLAKRHLTRAGYRYADVLAHRQATAERTRTVART